MITAIKTLEAMRQKTHGYWAERVLSELGFAVKLSSACGNICDKAVTDAVEFISRSFQEERSIPKEIALKAEKMIYGLSENSKKYKMICAAHAHIDMNWMWGYDETTAIALDTFRTMLDMMKEYPGYVFSQSQASVYRIVEENDPAMLDEIKSRIKEGRWEVTASSWVETDKNMPNGESLSRHILYTKRYLSKLFDIDPETLDIDFEPDTFGHNANVPEILSNGGVKYYYFCRGYDGHDIFRWEAPSGGSVTAYREPAWYNSGIEPDMAMNVPDFCRRNNVDTMLKVYGVGDHGGGPTRRDIEKIIDMNTWPVFPEIRFGSFREYFKILEKNNDKLPIVNEELNFVFPGCYTTQTRIKTANRIAEAKLYEAEAFSAVSAVFFDGRYDRNSFFKAWEKTLFNHFHDILPGSGTIETREYALGQFQQIMAAANTQASISARHIASLIDTSGFEEEEQTDSISEGAGAGYAIKDFCLPQTERGSGKKRMIHFFNPTAYQRKEIVEFSVWDWPGNKSRLDIKDHNGGSVGSQIIKEFSYWGHSCIKILAEVTVPSIGYSTYQLGEKDPENVLPELIKGNRTTAPDEFVMENGSIKIVFDVQGLSIKSFINKKDGIELVDKDRASGVFRLIDEDDAKGMTAWIVGRYMNTEVLNKNVKVTSVQLNRNSLRQWICYETVFRSSKIKTNVSLDKNSNALDFNVECEWKEVSEKGKGIPQLNFYVPLNYRCGGYVYDIPFGTIKRKDMDMDVPGNSFVLGMPEGEKGTALMLLTATKYGFRGTGDSIAADLIRSSCDPDPYPEYGMHNFRFAVCAVDAGSKCGMIEASARYNHPIFFVSAVTHSGALPPLKSFISLEKGNAAVSCIKMPEDDTDNKKMIVRVYETEGENTQVQIRMDIMVKDAYFVDINERPVIKKNGITINGNHVMFDIAGHSMESICIKMK